MRRCKGSLGGGGEQDNVLRQKGGTQTCRGSFLLPDCEEEDVVAGAVPALLSWVHDVRRLRTEVQRAEGGGAKAGVEPGPSMTSLS